MAPQILKPGYTVGVLACGTMGTAVLNAIITSIDKPTSSSDNSVPLPGKFLTSVNSQGSVDRLNKMFGDKVTTSIGNNNELVEQSDLIILGCKPFLADAILSAIPQELFKGKTVVSLLAGKTIAQLTELTGASVARAMTNTPSKIGAGMTVVSLPPGISDSVRESISWIFNNTGRCLFMDEKYMDVATALCGSGPAFCFLMIEALSDGAVKMGMPYPVAQECAAQVLHGAAQMVLEGNHPAVLRNAVCTPGGTTISGLMTLEDNKVRSAVANAVVEATNVATRLGQPKK